MSYEKLAQVVMTGRHRIPKLMDIICNTYNRVPTIGTFDKHLSIFRFMVPCISDGNNEQKTN
jgi:hypothetical protein